MDSRGLERRSDALPDTLTELERLERAATPGPWVLGDPDCHYVVAYVGDLTISPRDECPAEECDYRQEVDAALIAAARNHFPALLAVARAAAELSREALVDDDMSDEAFYDAVGDVCAAVEALLGEPPKAEIDIRNAQRRVNGYPGDRPFA